MNQYQAYLYLFESFFIEVSDMVMKFHKLDIFNKMLLQFWPVVCTRLQRENICKHSGDLNNA